MNWVHRVSLGAKVLFWAVLVFGCLPNLAMFLILPVWYGPVPRWPLIFPAIERLMAVVAILAITTPVPQRGQTGGMNALRVASRIFVILAVVGQVRVSYLWSAVGSGHVILAVSAISVGEKLLLCTYGSGLASRFEETTLARSLLCVGWAFVLLWLTWVGLSLSPGLLESVEPGVVTWARFLATLVVWAWALWTIWQFAHRIPLAAADRCISCGYPSKYLPEPRCPECGFRLS